MRKFSCDEINQAICYNFHPQTRFPECNGCCNDYYEYVLIQDMRKDILASKGILTSFRGGINVAGEKRSLVQELYRKLEKRKS